MSYFAYALSYLRRIVIIFWFCGINEATFVPNVKASDNILESSKNFNNSPKSLFDKRVKYALEVGISPLSKELRTGKSDCEALAHFIQTSVPNHYSNELKNNIPLHKADAVNPLTATHQPYTGYVLLNKNKDYMRPDNGDWGSVHFFIVTGDGRYLSRNGLGPIRIFSSYQNMLLADGFPRGFVDDRGHPIESKTYPQGVVDEDGRSIEYKEGMIPSNAVVGESIIFSLQDMTGSEPPPLSEFQASIYTHKNTTGK